MDSNDPLVPIGTIHTPFQTKEEAPIQGVFALSATGTVIIREELEPGLKDIDGFTHLILIYRFDRCPGRIGLVKPMLLDDAPHGILASRNPMRPNRIGLTVVRYLRRERNVIGIGGVDMLDNTPLLDVKPYVPRFDSFPEASEGWFSGKNDRPKPPGRG
ncbi:MAG TPA: tRNA (N6-threonylcarbamoyladenosine(37)-N6)-methyltransferase TrmO [Elusimicrobia bacterium]|nr:tRNA (N6-threonylcarbamoyladenosine(37)-N6)-methyltransferase TrmO [Elusimicrobiota bacterium]